MESPSSLESINKLISHILRQIVGLYLPSTAEILVSLFLPTLSALNNFLHNYDFVIIMMEDSSTTKELHFTMISKAYALITSNNIKQFINF